MEQLALVLLFGKMIEVVKYNSDWFDKWNLFLIESRTNSFLHSRYFMEYHKDRFQDYSLIVIKDGNIVALLPANKRPHENVIESHGGLTFGGLITKTNDKPINTLIYFKSILEFLAKNQIDKLLYKQPPSFYSACSQEEVEYAIFLTEGKLIRMDTTFTIDNSIGEKIKYQERRKRSIKKAVKLGAEIKETKDFSEYWKQILTPNLQQRFGVKPVHSLEEISQLSQNNPTHIRQFNAYLNGEILAGATVFETPLVAHAQYISAKDEGRRNGALDYLFDNLISEVFKTKAYFDFGIVNEEQGRSINKGLWDWKEGFGAKVFAHRFYEIHTNNHHKIITE